MSNPFNILGRKSGVLQVQDILKFPDILESLGVNISGSTLPSQSDGVLTSTSGVLSWETPASDTIYTADGTLDGSRVIDGDNNDIAIQNAGVISFAGTNFIGTSQHVTLGDYLDSGSSTLLTIDDSTQTTTLSTAGVTPSTPTFVIEQTGSLPTGPLLRLQDSALFTNPTGHGIEFRRAATVEASIINGAELSITSTGGRGLTLASTGTVTVGTAGATLVFPEAIVNYTALPTFADNSAATGGGLATNRLYKTATGEIRIVV